MRLRPVDSIMHPASRLLDANCAPLSLGKKIVLRDGLRDILRQDHVAVLVVVRVVIFIRVVDAVRHYGKEAGALESSQLCEKAELHGG